MDVHREKPVRCKDFILIKHTPQNFGSLTFEQLENSLPDKKGWGEDKILGRGEIKFRPIFLHKV